MDTRNEIYEELKERKYLGIEDIVKIIERDESSTKINVKVKARVWFDRIIRMFETAKRQTVEKNRKPKPMMVFSEGDEIKVHDSWCRYAQREVFHLVCENECDFYGKCLATEMFKKMNLYKDREA